MSTMSKLEQLRAAFSNNNNSNQNNTSFTKFYRFYEMKEGESCRVRFLPDRNQDNPLGFLVENKYHNLEINGRRRRVPSLTMFGEDCPIAALSRQFYDAGDRDNGKKYYRKVDYIGQVLIIDDPLTSEDGESNEGKVLPITLGYQIYNIIKEAFSSVDEDALESLPYGTGGEDDDPDAWGYDFIIKKTRNGDYASYALGTKFANRSRPLTDEEIAAVEEQSVDLSTYLPEKPTLEKVEAMLAAAVNGSDIDVDEYEDKEFSSPKAKKPTAKSRVVEDEDDEEDDVPAPKTKSKPKAVSADEEVDVEALLAKIRSRKAD